mmetsp:Transcript_96439/g.241820  ORF Transcript_96439/g.241820 Transcript_96439/m.241820 type:complete len:204 (-) Transcript_96439:94-705(-)
MTGCTNVEHCRWGKNLAKLSRTCRAPCALAASTPAAGLARKAFSRYSSGEMGLSSSSRRSRRKSRRSQSSAGLLEASPPPPPWSSTCSAKLQTKESALKRPSFSTPFVFSTKTEEINKQSDMSLASLTRSDSVLPKPSQSTKRRPPLPAPHIHSPSVHALDVEPTRKRPEAPRWRRPRRRFRRKLFPVRYGPQTVHTLTARWP